MTKHTKGGDRAAAPSIEPETTTAENGEQDQETKAMTEQTAAPQTAAPQTAAPKLAKMSFLKRPETIKKRLRTTTIFTGTKGGIGKTFVSQMSTTILDDRDDTAEGQHVWKFVQLDDARISANQNATTLAQRVDLTMGSYADLAEAKKDPANLLRHYDKLGNMMLRSPLCLDMGANTQRGFLTWAAASKIVPLANGKGTGFDINVVTDPTDDSLESALWCLRNFHKLFGTAELPSRFALIKNDRNGKGFRPSSESPLMKEIEEFCKAIGAPVIEIGHLNNRLLDYDPKMSPLDVFENAEDVGRAMGILSDDEETCDEVGFMRDYTELHEHLFKTQNALQPILPQPMKLAA